LNNSFNITDGAILALLGFSIKYSTKSALFRY